MMMIMKWLAKVGAPPHYGGRAYMVVVVLTKRVTRGGR